jgi:hypothetical protein
MKAALLTGLTDQEKDEVRQSFAASSRFREKLREVLRMRVNANNKTVRSKDSYGVANWAYLQADAVGYERALVEVISLLTHDQPEIEVPTGAEIGTQSKGRGRPKKVTQTL